MLKDTPRSRMWESCLSGSERGLGTTMARLLESLSYSKMHRIKNNPVNPVILSKIRKAGGIPKNWDGRVSTK